MNSAVAKAIAVTLPNSVPLLKGPTARPWFKWLSLMRWSSTLTISTKEPVEVMPPCVAHW